MSRSRGRIERRKYVLQIAASVLHRHHFDAVLERPIENEIISEGSWQGIDADISQMWERGFPAAPHKRKNRKTHKCMFCDDREALGRLNFVARNERINLDQVAKRLRGFADAGGHFPLR